MVNTLFNSDKELMSWFILKGASIDYMVSRFINYFNKHSLQKCICRVVPLGIVYNYIYNNYYI